MVAHAPPSCARIVEQAVALVGSRYTRKSISTPCTVSYGRWQRPRTVAARFTVATQLPRDLRADPTPGGVVGSYTASSTCHCQSRVTARRRTNAGRISPSERERVSSLQTRRCDFCECNHFFFRSLTKII